MLINHILTPNQPILTNYIPCPKKYLPHPTFSPPPPPLAMNHVCIALYR